MEAGVLRRILGSPDPNFRPKNVAIGIFLFLSYSFGIETINTFI